MDPACRLRGTRRCQSALEGGLQCLPGPVVLARGTFRCVRACIFHWIGVVVSSKEMAEASTGPLIWKLIGQYPGYWAEKEAILCRYLEYGLKRRPMPVQLEFDRPRTAAS